MELKLLAKKLVYLYTSLALIVSFLGVSVSAEESLDLATQKNEAVCSLPSESSVSKNEEFIQLLKKNTMYQGMMKMYLFNIMKTKQFLLQLLNQMILLPHLHLRLKLRLQC